MAMKTPTKVVVWGGVATVLLGPPLVIGTLVTVAGGAGTFLSGALRDGLPAFVDGFQQYEPGTNTGIFPAPPADPADPADTTPPTVD